ncbi:MAG: major capsid protein [Betaproteobacteria bacterium]|nr:major capsid protein [Betaproteobacteria bacterium]
MDRNYDTDTLVEVIGGLEPFETFLLSLFFPGVITFETSSISFDKVSEDMRLAPFVSPLVAGKVMKQLGSEMRTFKPAYLKPKDVVDPERVFVRRPGEQIGGTLSPEQRRNAIIADILADHRKRILRRMEHMAAQILLTGKVVVEGEDYPTQEVDFYRSPGNTLALTGATRWSESTAKPLDDVESWAAQAEAPITTLIMDRHAYRNFVRFEEVQKLLDGRRNSRSELETGPDTGRLYSYKGTLGSDLEVWVYSGYYRDEAKQKIPFLPPNTVIAGSAAVDGVRAYGAIIDSSAGYRAMEMFPKNWINQDPAVEYVMTQSAPLPIPRHPDAALAITVA